MAVAEHELEEQMRERFAGDRHAQVRDMREVDRGLAPRRGDLLKEHLRLDAVVGPPVPKAPLQRPRLPGVKLRGVPRAQHLQHSLRFEHALQVALEQRLDVRAPDGPVSHSRAVRKLMLLAAAAAAWVLPAIRFCLMSRTCASVTMATTLAQSGRLTPSGRSNCR